MPDSVEKDGITICKADITTIDTDAIVNPSNTSLILGAGVSGAIARAGGPSIQKEMSGIGSCPVGGAVVTGAGLLKAKYVVHAVGPRMGEGEEDEKLRSATVESIRRAEELKLTSIAYPAISTGIFGYPVERCAKVMLTACREFLQSDSPHSLTKIIFCLFGDEAFEIFKKELG